MKSDGCRLTYRTVAKRRWCCVRAAIVLLGAVGLYLLVVTAFGTTESRYTFQNVCIEALSPPINHTLPIHKLKVSETAKIVVYNVSETEGLRNLQVSGSPNSRWNHWDVYFRQRQIPASHTVSRKTAFFVVQTCEANFHHFWIDEFVPLYETVRRSGRLYPGADNQIFYRLPFRDLEPDRNNCHNAAAFQDILRTLYTVAFHDVFYRAPLNVCYDTAVFGAAEFAGDPREVVDHVKANMLGKLPANGSFVTFIDRRYRRILNVNELLDAAVNAGFHRVRIVDFERHSVAEQMHIAATSYIMVGVKGAALQWAVFMDRNCSLIEVAWPSRDWHFYYRKFVEPYGIHYRSLNATDVRVDWDAYELRVRNGTKVGPEERKRLSTERPKSASFDNIWKWADVVVNKDELVALLLAVNAQRTL